MTLRPFAVAIVASVLLFARPAGADPEEFPPPPPPYPAHAAPLYLIVSFDDTFIVDGENPSQTILVNIGSLVGGNGFINTRFVVNSALTTITYPEGTDAPTFQQLADNSATVVGSFETADLSEIHMVTPAPGEIPPDIQAAVFRASHSGALDALLIDSPFPTTVQIADAIAAQLPEGSISTPADVLTHVFGTVAPLNAGDVGVSTVGEGEMFPHKPQSVGLFHYRVELSSDGSIATDVCLRVGVDIHPGSSVNPVNVKKKGVVPIAILSVPGFDALDVIPDTATIGGVAASKSTEEDVDDDGDLDLLLHWDVEDLVAAGALTATSTSLTVTAETSAGDCVIGTDVVRPSKK